MLYNLLEDAFEYFYMLERWPFQDIKVLLSNNKNLTMTNIQYIKKVINLLLKSNIQIYLITLWINQEYIFPATRF